MHSSFFNYNLTRPYPYKWFTPVALAGAVILVVLLSVMNFVQNSYTLVVQYVENPNATIANGAWFSDWPPYLTSSVKPTCQPANLPVNSQFFTNQTGLMWTLTSITKDNDTATASPSLPYMNNVLENCEVNNIQLQLGDTPLVQTAQQLGAIIVTTDVQVRAFVSCAVQGPTGYIRFNATALYDTISPNTVAGSASFVASDRTRKASMYWAEALLSAYWLQTVASASGNAFPAYSPFRQEGLVLLFPSKSQDDIRSDDFFKITYTFLEVDRTHPAAPALQLSLTSQSELLNSVGHYIEQGGVRNEIIRPIDSLAKSMYSAVLTDLGQTAAPSQSNIVANATTLQYFSQNCSLAASLSSIENLPLIQTQDYDTVQKSASPSGPLDLTRSVISTEYLCQVPQRKPLGDVFIAVLLADLVLLQAAWKLYTFGVDQIMSRTHSSARVCEGCLDQDEEKRWRLQHMAYPNRYLIKNGNLAPVVSAVGRDSGSDHSSISR